MLAKKFYAQRNTRIKSKSSQLSVSSSGYLKQRLACCGNIVKKSPIRSASETTEYLRSKTVKCAVDNGNYKKYENSGCTGCDKVTNDVTKDVRVADDSMQHIEKVKALVNCNDADYRGIVVSNDKC